MPKGVRSKTATTKAKKDTAKPTPTIQPVLEDELTVNGFDFAPENTTTDTVESTPLNSTDAIEPVEITPTVEEPQKKDVKDDKVDSELDKKMDLLSQALSDNEVVDTEVQEEKEVEVPKPRRMTWQEMTGSDWNGKIYDC